MWDSASLTLSYSANATGWARSGQVCIEWELQYKEIGPNESYRTHSSGSKCGTGSASIATHAAFCPARGFWRMVSNASGPGGSDSDSKSVYVVYP